MKVLSCQIRRELTFYNRCRKFFRLSLLPSFFLASVSTDEPLKTNSLVMTRDGTKLVVVNGRSGELRSLRTLDDLQRPTELFVVSNKWIK